MKRWAVVWAVVLLSSTASDPAIAQRDVQRARPISPDVTAANVEPVVTPLDTETRIRFLEDLVARATPGQLASGAGTLNSWLASSSATLERADVRLTPRKPYSEPPMESYMRALGIAVWSPSGGGGLPSGFIRDPSKLEVSFDPSASVGDLYLVDFELYVVEGEAHFHLSEPFGFCQINFKRDDTLPLGPGKDVHLLAVIQFAQAWECVLTLEETTGVEWGLHAWEATRMD